MKISKRKSVPIKKAQLSSSAGYGKAKLVKPELPECFFKKCSEPMPLSAIDLRDYVRMPIPNPKPLLGNWLLKPSLSMIHAPRGVGKTYLGLFIGCAVAAGQDLFGWSCARARKVHYLDGEMSSKSLQTRIRSLPKRMRPPKGMFNISTPDFQAGILPDLSTRVGQDLINQGIAPDTDLIIVDNLSSWCKSGREDSEAWAPIAEWALRHRSEGRSVTLIHHSGKNGTQRGTSRKEDLLDVVLGLKRPPGYSPGDGASFEIHFEKCRHMLGDDVAPVQVKLVTDADGKLEWQWGAIQQPSNERLKEMLRLKSQGKKQCEIAKDLNTTPSTVSRTLRKVK